jgi:YHS domain-containing protein
VRFALLCIALAMLSLGFFGCQKAQETPAEQAGTQMEQATPAEEDVVIVDPVCGMQVSKDSEWTAEYDGKTYYFCSQSCRDQFTADPMQYMKDETTEMQGHEGM